MPMQEITDHLAATVAGLDQRGERIGRADAPVTLTFWADLQCPSCKAFALTALTELLTHEVRDGDLAVRLRPLATATPDAQEFVLQHAATTAAGEQDRLWDFAEAFFLTQRAEGSGHVTPAYLALVAQQIDGLDDEAAHAMPGGTGNSIAWLLWHAARQMDVQTAALSGRETVWASGGWAARLGVDRSPDDFGFGDSLDDVAALRVTDVAALADHLEACIAALVHYVRTLSDADLADVVDTSYTPPVTRAVRIVSMIDDAVVHLGQAAYARGLVDGWSLGV